MALLPPLLLLVLAVSTTSFTPHHPRWQLSNRRSILRRAPESRDRLSVRRKAAEDDQSRAPIVEALQEAASNIRAPFFFPGHKMGMEFPLDLDGAGAQEEGVTSRTSPWCYDLPEIPELDNLFSPEGPIKEAEELAAKAFGAKKTWFLVNGSTAGILAAVMACVRRHQQQQAEAPPSHGPSHRRPSKVILPLNVHKSAINALVLSGGEPLFVSPLYDPQLDLCHGPPLHGPGGLAEVLREEAKTGQLACVLLVSPTYHGVLGDVQGAVALCKEAGVPLIVDEAHGAHLRFMPRGALLTGRSTQASEDGQEEGEGEGEGEDRWDALSLGADVVVQSTHKTLAALSQAGMLHVGEGVDDELCGFLSSALQMVQSSSPNYLLLASLDAARRHVAHAPSPPSPSDTNGATSRGRTSLQKAVELANQARRGIEASNVGLGVLSLPSDGSTLRGAFVALDPLRLTVHGQPEPLSGYALDDVMIGEWGVYAELPAARSLTFAFGPGSRPEDARALVEALTHAATQILNPTTLDKGDAGEEEGSEAGEVEGEESVSPPPSFPPYDPLGLQRRRLCSPRDAYLTPSELLPTDTPDIIGRASAEIVCPYPPGIPVLLPGEVVSQEALDYLMAVLQAGGSVMGCTDATLKTLRVLKAKPE